MNPIDELFQRLRDNGEKAFMPFVTAGDPNLDFTAEVIQKLDQSGCHLCEVGFPYSDPIADGPVIQSSYTRALEQGVSVNSIFKTVKRASRNSSMPLVAMVSWAIVFRRGVHAFIKDAMDAGFSGAIIPDLLIDDATDFRQAFQDADFKLIPLITPTTPRDRAVSIARQATGFIYYVSITGITGERTTLPDRLVEDLQWLKQQVETPVCVGFGISTPEQATQISQYCDGIIVGSAIVRRIQEAANASVQHVLKDVSDYASELVEAVKPSGS